METVQVAVPLSDDGDCRQCQDRLRDSLRAIRGVAGVELEPRTHTMVVSYDPEVASLSDIQRQAADLEAGLASRYAHESLTITDMDCGDCAAKLEAAIARLPGVLFASVNFAAGKMRVEYDTHRVSHRDIVAGVRSLGYDVHEPSDPTSTITSEFRLSGLDCADCAATVEKGVAVLPGVVGVRIDFASARLTVTHRRSLPAADIVGLVEHGGYGAVPLATGRRAPEERPFWVRNRRALLTAASGVTLLAGFALMLLRLPRTPTDTLFAISILLGGYHVARSGLYGLVRSRSLDMNVLMTLAVVGAAAIGEWQEGATAMFLFAVGNALEGYTVDRARGAIRSLMELAPNQAQVKRDGAEVTVPVDYVRVGNVVVVRPGEKLPMDGRVVSGASAVDQAPITGESLPVEVGPGDSVFAGTINQQGYLEIEITKPYAENTLAKIIHMVEEAQGQRAPSQRFVDRFAYYYTPAVIGIAVAIATVPWLGLGQPFGPWFYRALVLLVIACPCALVISTPVSIVSAIARAARLGVLIKGGAYLEEAGSLQVVAFDKTGTLTAGRPEVTDVISLPTTGDGRPSLSEDELLGMAAAIEARSEHPLAAAVLRRAGQHAGGEPSHLSRRENEEQRHIEVADFEAVIGRGVRARIDGRAYHLGNSRFFEELGIPLDPVQNRLDALRQAGKTVLLVARDSEPVGMIALADRVRPGAREAISALRKAGIRRVVLLTGDHEATARAVTEAVGADEYRAGLLPEDKVTAVRELIDRYGKVAMVGDGVNDAPALAAATVGIAMGAAGTDVALETADIALMADDLSRVAYTIGLSCRARSTIQQNIIFSLVIKAAFVALTVPGLATLWLAILADTGASLAVTLNGMRLLRYGGRTGSDSNRHGGHLAPAVTMAAAHRAPT